LLFGAAFACLWAALMVVRLRLHGPAGEPMMAALDPLSGPRFAAAAALSEMAGSLFGPLLTLFFLFVLRVLLRKEWAAAIVCVLLLALLNSSGTAYPAVDWPISLLESGLAVFVLMRYGMLVLMVGSTLANFLLGIPRTLDFSLWYAPMGVLPLVLAALVAIYGFRISLAGRPLFKDIAE
jgi:hypothetical protein